MNERRIRKTTIERSGNRYYNRGFNLEILDDSGRQHRLYGSSEEMYDLVRKILQALPNTFARQTRVQVDGRAGIESRLYAISHNLSTEHHISN